MRNQANSRIAAEVAQFDAVGGQWWDEQGPFKPLHALNPVRMQYIVGQIGTVRGKRILDIACGGGLVTEPLARLGAKVTGIDTSKNAIAAARAHAAGEGLEIDYHCCSLEEFISQKNPPLLNPLPQGEGKHMRRANNSLPPRGGGLRWGGFDVITALEILEHVDNPKEFVLNASKLLKPGGVIIFSTINRTVKSLLLAKIAAEEILGIVPRGTHSWNKFIQPAELAEMAEAAHLTVKDITGLTVNPIRAGTQMFALTKDVAINYFLTAMRRVK